MSLQIRPPVVTILGHIDHGKTSLLDYIRKTAVVAKEHGGITQAIGAYQATVDGKLITFIDTPGHAAFEKMRSRGAQVADIATLVIAVDDGVMPQTIEAIKHIKTANIPMIVAVTKIDLPGVNLKVQLEKIKKQLSDHQVLVEEYGGEVPIVTVSAKTGEGVLSLLETINLLAEIHEFKADPTQLARGIIIESRTDKSKGPLATVLIRDGSLRKGDVIFIGGAVGKVKGMFDFSGKAVESAGPSVPIEVLGFQSLPSVGAHLGEALIKEVVAEKALPVSLLDKLKETQNKVLNVVIRADNAGSLEAMEGVLQKFNQQEHHLTILSSGTGDISDSDIELAHGTKGIVLGFNVSVSPSAKKVVEIEHVLVRTYQVIYEMIDELDEVVKEMLKPGRVEEVFGRGQIIAEFPFGKGERIAGCQVVDGVINKGPKVRIVREGEVLGETKIKSLKKTKEEVSKVEKGVECGMIFDPALDFKIGDLVESFRAF